MLKFSIASLYDNQFLHLRQSVDIIIDQCADAVYVSARLNHKYGMCRIHKLYSNGLGSVDTSVP